MKFMMELADMPAARWMPPHCRFGAQCWSPGCVFLHEQYSDSQQVLVGYWSAAPARVSATPAKEHVAPASQRDLMTRYAQWDKFAADLPSDTDSAAEDGSDMCKAGFVDAPRAVIRGSGMCEPGSANNGPHRVVDYGSGTCSAGLIGDDHPRAAHSSGQCKAGLAGDVSSHGVF